MKKSILILPLLFLALLLTGCGSGPDQPPAPTSIPLANPQSGNPDPAVAPQHPLNLPPDFGVTVYAEGLSGPRMLAFSPDGQLFVSEPSQGQVLRIIDADQDGVAESSAVAADGLLEPSGVAFYQDGSLYVAETTRILRMTDPDGDGYYQEREIIAAGFAAGGNTNRTIIFSPDWRQLYLAIGSSCNVCREEDPRRAGVMRFNADGSEGRIFAQGLRYVIGLDFQPETDILWAANMERTGLEGSLPPDTLYAIYVDANAGWPFCHAGRITDPEFGNKDSCGEDLLTPVAELEAGVSPYGMTFYTGEQFPAEYQKDLFIALHGSGEGAAASGYKIIRIPLGEGLEPRVEDFITGWLGSDGLPWGAPTDLLQGPDGSLFLSDDLGGVIYRIFYTGE